MKTVPQHLEQTPRSPARAAVSVESTIEPLLDDLRSNDPAVRLLEDSWQTRSRTVGRREQLVEAGAGALFLCFAVPLAVAALGAHRLDVGLAAALVALYAFTSRMIVFPIGAGNVVPSYLVLVPMLLLLPPGVVPLLTAAGLVLGAAADAVMRRAGADRVLLAIPDAWHALGPAVVLLLAGRSHAPTALALVYLAAFAAGCLLDLLSAMVREWAIFGIRSHVQLRVIALVWLIDAGVAPVGLLLAHAMRQEMAAVLLILPLNGVLWLVARDRSATIARAQRRLDAVARERARLQTAVGRIGEALAAKLDLRELTDLLLRSSIDALDGDAGLLSLSGPFEPRVIELDGVPGPDGAPVTLAASPAPALQTAVERSQSRERPCQLERDGMWALALPLGFASTAGPAYGAGAVARAGRPFREDEQAVMLGLVEHARQAAAQIVAHQRLRDEAFTDSLTKLGNRRKLAADLDERLATVSPEEPLVLILFDLDGFKSYNDTFGHQAGDAVLARLGGKLAASVSAYGCGYRLGGDEFCALIAVEEAELDAVVAATAGALEERGENFAVRASFGAVLLPHEATSLDYAVQLADERMYARKRARASLASDPTRDVLVQIMQARQPVLKARSNGVASLCLRVGRRMNMSGEELDELARAAELHDVGKVGIPDAILDKPGALNESEWEFMRQHTVLGERILSAAPALRPVALLVRATHERWDGHGYPDHLAREQIPLGARIIAACDAYDAMTSARSYGKRSSHTAACEELRREAGRQFDPRVIDNLLEELQQLGRAPLAAPAENPDEDSASQPAGEVVALLREVLAEHDRDRERDRERAAASHPPKRVALRSR